MVQIGDSHANINAHPVGQVVKFSTFEKMKAPSFLWEPIPTGSAIIVERMIAAFRNTATVCNLAMTLESVEARIPCVTTQPRKTTYTSPLLGVQSPSFAITILCEL